MRQILALVIRRQLCEIWLRRVRAQMLWLCHVENGTNIRIQELFTKCYAKSICHWQCQKTTYFVIVWVKLKLAVQLCVTLKTIQTFVSNKGQCLWLSRQSGHFQYQRSAVRFQSWGYFIMYIFTVHCWKDENKQLRGPWMAHFYKKKQLDPRIAPKMSFKVHKTIQRYKFIQHKGTAKNSVLFFSRFKY